MPQDGLYNLDEHDREVERLSTTLTAQIRHAKSRIADLLRREAEERGFAQPHSQD